MTRVAETVVSRYCTFCSDKVKALCGCYLCGDDICPRHMIVIGSVNEQYYDLHLVDGSASSLAVNFDHTPICPTCAFGSLLKLSEAVAKKERLLKETR